MSLLQMMFLSLIREEVSVGDEGRLLDILIPSISALSQVFLSANHHNFAEDPAFGVNFNVSRVVIIKNVRRLPQPLSVFGSVRCSSFQLPPDYTWQIVRDRVQQFGDAESVEMIAAGVARVRFALIQVPMIMSSKKHFVEQRGLEFIHSCTD